VGARFSAPIQTGPGAHPASCTMVTWSFLGVKSGRGVTLTLHPFLVPLVTKEYSYTSTPPLGRNGLYRASVPVKGVNFTYDNINPTIPPSRISTVPQLAAL